MGLLCMEQFSFCLTIGSVCWSGFNLCLCLHLYLLLLFVVVVFVFVVVSSSLLLVS